MNKHTPLTRMSLSEAVNAIVKGIANEDFAAKNTALSVTELEEFKNAALSLVDARNFIAKVAAKEKFATDTFRYGYIGRKVYDMDSCEFVQTNRGKPYGYLAAVLGADGKTIYAGFTYVSEDEKYAHSVIGQKIALERAIANRDAGVDIEKMTSSPYLKGKDKAQWQHFKNRVYRYFRPEEFSHSRGKTPLEQSNFDEVHTWQYLMLARNAKTKTEFKEAMKLLETAIKNVNPKIK